MNTSIAGTAIDTGWLAFDECLAMQVAARQRAEADIADVQALAYRYGFELNQRPAPARTDRPPNAVIGKSRPQLDQWIRRALPDRTLPRPTDNLVLPARMVQRGLALGYIEGTRHPYRATQIGLAWAESCLKANR